MKQLTTYALILFVSFLTAQISFAQDKGDVVNSNLPAIDLVENLYPNPAYVGNPIYISLNLKESSKINVIVLDMIGNKLVDHRATLEAGYHQDVHFHSDKLSQGVYFVNIISDNYKHVQRLIVR